MSIHSKLTEILECQDRRKRTESREQAKEQHREQLQGEQHSPNTTRDIDKEGREEAAKQEVFRAHCRAAARQRRAGAK